MATLQSVGIAIPPTHSPLQALPTAVGGATAGTTSSGALTSAAAKLLEEWEARTNLNDLQRSSVAELQSLCMDLPLPTTLANQPATSNAPISINGMTSTETTSLSLSDVDGLGEPIENAQQFFNWFARVESRMERGREDVYRSYLNEIVSYRDLCDSLLHKLDETTTLLRDLEGNYFSVAMRASALQEACEKLLQQQTYLVSLADALSDRLSYFNELEVIARLFNTPGETVVLHSQFIPMLSRLDQCLAYVESNPKFKDSEIYLMKFRQCMTRGLTLIKMHFNDTIKLLSSDIQARLLKEKPSQEGLTESAETALFYVKFRALAPSLRSLIVELEQRANNNEYASLLSECHNAYIISRTQLLSQSISAKIQAQARSTQLVQFGRSGTAFILRVCADELQLFNHFFSTVVDAAQSLLDSLVSHFHDVVRPRIIRENSVDVLAELCEVLLVQMTSALPVGTTENDRFAFQLALRGILEDAQQRLIFRIQSVMTSEIEGFAPKPSDLDYPDRLTRPATSNEPNNHNESDQTSVESNLTIHGESYKDWYPTLRISLSLLSKLYRCVNARLFDGLSQEIIAVCQNSLMQACAVISRQKTKMDGQLFLIQHLLILREQLAPFDTSFIHTERFVDLDQLRSAAQGLMEKGSRLLLFSRDNAIFSFLQTSLPKAIVTSERDSKKEVENELKRTCDTLINDVTKSVAEPISSFLAKATAFKVSVKDKNNQKLRDQPFAAADDVIGLCVQVRLNVENVVALFVVKTHLYLKDDRTELVLFKAVKGAILSIYKQYLSVLQNDYDVRVVASAMTLQDLRTCIDIAASPLLTRTSSNTASTTATSAASPTSVGSPRPASPLVAS